nr:ABC transporter ATP-binding protein [Conchiformibius kuhniae]
MLGHSGCGKTTALRCIAGFETAASGSIALNGRTLFSGSLNVPPHQRRIGMVFQDYALFPHLNIAANVAFGIAKQPAAERKRRVDELLALIGLPDYGKHYPHQLSGGQQQRVALARALAPRPDLILLDEPFSSLDADLRTRLSQEVGKLLKQERTSAILVTHDQHEAFAMADKIGMMADGTLHQWDDPQTLYRRPATPAVAAFVGQGAWLTATADADGSVQTAIGRTAALLPENHHGTLRLRVRPEHLRADPNGKTNARVAECAFTCGGFQYTLQLDNGETLHWLDGSHRTPDSRIALRFADTACPAAFHN